ncbi:MAG: hypothetical protein JO265_06000 [Acidimicrobiia bacterium]|nr:hypothetical protein [Acidimicrobiia bacterium]
MADESSTEQEVVELLNELRVVLPGVQVLFAFLLTVPFSQRFTQLRPDERGIYFAALMFAAGSSALLIAPSVYARLTWRHIPKARLLQVANPLAIWGTVLLAGGIGCAVYLIADVLYHSALAGIFTAAVSVLILVAWYGVPLYDRLRAGSRLSQGAGG